MRSSKRDLDRGARMWRNDSVGKRYTTHSLSEPPGNGWKPWIDPRPWPQEDNPYNHQKVELWRKEWGRIHIEAPRDNPWTNAVGLWWRPVRD